MTLSEHDRPSVDEPVAWSISSCQSSQATGIDAARVWLFWGELPASGCRAWPGGPAPRAPLPPRRPPRPHPPRRGGAGQGAATATM